MSNYAQYGADLIRQAYREGRDVRLAYRNIVRNANTREGKQAALGALQAATQWVCQAGAQLRMQIRSAIPDPLTGELDQFVRKADFMGAMLRYRSLAAGSTKDDAEYWSEMVLSALEQIRQTGQVTIPDPSAAEREQAQATLVRIVAMPDRETVTDFQHDPEGNVTLATQIERDRV